MQSDPINPQQRTSSIDDYSLKLYRNNPNKFRSHSILSSLKLDSSKEIHLKNSSSSSRKPDMQEVIALLQPSVLGSLELNESNFAPYLSALIRNHSNDLDHARSLSTGDSSSTDSGSWNLLLPGQPSELRAMSVTPHTVTLAWTMPLASEKSPPVYLYSIRYRRLDSERDQVLNTSKTTMEETVYGLHADKTYEFSVMAWNTLGGSLESVPLRINTDT